MEGFGSRFKNEKWEQSFNEELILFCTIIKGIAVKQGCPILMNKLLVELSNEFVAAYDWKEESTSIDKSDYKLKVLRKAID
jgi:hypothetical protein